MIQGRNGFCPYASPETEEKVDMKNINPQDMIQELKYNIEKNICCE